ncbi:MULTISPECIES: hypothetical protein [Streptomyces]|nr:MULTISPECIES: hypothetical protein [Streptomyces]MDN3056184.1 hypothetical protein [Streptomyces sp. SRF1]
MMLRRYHRPPPDAEPSDQAAAEQPANAPQAQQPAGRSAARGKTAKTDGR